MRKNKIIAYITIAILIVCNVFMMYSIHKTKTENESTLAILYPYAQKHTSLKANIEANIKYSSRTIDDVEITDREQNKKKLSELFKDNSKPLFLVRISERYCNSCVKYTVDLFSNKNLKKDINFIFLTGFANQNRVNYETNELGLKTNDFYNVLFLNVPIDNAGYPYLMVLNPNLEIEYCYFPTKDHEEIDIENINMIIDCYAEKL